MNVRQLRDNGELFQYLSWLGDQLRTRGQRELADDVLQASRFVSGSTSEFLHEARSTLKKVDGVASQVLTQAELEDVRSVIQQIDAAFKTVGGA